MIDPSRSIFLSSYGQRADSPLQRFVKHFDWLLFADILILCLLGLATVYSASLRFGRPEIYLGKQLAAFSIGFGALFLLATLNYQIFSQHARVIFAFSLTLLVLVLLAGSTFKGTKAWFVIGPFAFQPSEISKLLTILVLSSWCDKNSRELRHWSGLLVPFCIVLCPVGLILLQPDFGSTLVYFPILIGILFIAGARVLYLAVIVFQGLMAAAAFFLRTVLALSPDFLETHFVWNYIYQGMSFGKEFLVIHFFLALALALLWWLARELRLRIPGFYFVCAFLMIALGWVSGSVFSRSLKDYQRKRLVVFFKPGIDPLGSGYHVIQSVVALGSGKFFGKGLFSSTQGRLGFLPEQHTDFIFSILGEELGFIVSGFVILLYLLLIWRCIAIAGDSRDRFGSLVAVGIGSMFAFYTILNLCMVMGLAPVTGLPLPFLSYGGSSLVSSLAAAGILLSIHIRRYAY